MLIQLDKWKKIVFHGQLFWIKISKINTCTSLNMQMSTTLESVAPSSLAGNLAPTRELSVGIMERIKTIFQDCNSTLTVAKNVDCSESKCLKIRASTNKMGKL